MKILCAVDGSLNSKKALEKAKKIANSESDEIILITVVEQYAYPVYDELVEVSVAMEQIDQVNLELKKIGKTLIENLKEELTNEAIVNSGIVAQGDPRHVIVEKAKDLNVDIIIVGSRGLGLIKRLFLGSVSQYVVSNANCSVLVVKYDSVEDSNNNNDNSKKNNN
eukprot:TRINITY_DN38311_c0_g1_i2.p1 TRINITY_DN38311_c0_g1~~TRINITY_DN38311_c0_g1_i2.p1  ORF type:complete len:166 (+),score=27.25 TRINITY_DN38311_c0_g1_i2:66-563(+)